MRYLIIGEHAIDKGKERIPLLNDLSIKGIERWYQENIPFAEEIPFRSELYLELEKTYHKRDKQKNIYLRDSFGIYVIEFINQFRGFLHSVQEPNFRGNLRVKLGNFIPKEKVIKLGNVIGRRPQAREEIEDLIA